MAATTVGPRTFQAGQNVNVYPWPGDERRNVGEPRPAAIANATAAADGSLSLNDADLLSLPVQTPAYLAEGPRWPAGGGTQQAIITL